VCVAFVEVLELFVVSVNFVLRDNIICATMICCDLSKSDQGMAFRRIKEID